MALDAPAELAAQKARIRGFVRAQRRERSAAERGLARDGIAVQIGEAMAALTAAGHLTAPPATIAAYLARPDEPDVADFLANQLERGTRILVPVSRPARVLDWRELRPDLEIVAGAYGLPEPVGPDLGPAALAEAELILAPAAAVSASGDRLGWGLGYYDLALELASPGTPVVAVVFDDEVLPQIPTESHDKAVTAIATPRRMMLARAPQSAA